MRTRKGKAIAKNKMADNNPDEAREVNVIKYWLNAEEILAPRLCGASGTCLDRLQDACMWVKSTLGLGFFIS